VMTDALMEKARIDQELHPLDDDETETVEIDSDDDTLSHSDDPETETVEDMAENDLSKETH